MESSSLNLNTGSVARKRARKLAWVIGTRVPITHANLRALFRATEPVFKFNEDDSTVLFHSYAFDFSVWEMWSVLAYGGKLVIPDNETRLTPSTRG